MDSPRERNQTVDRLLRQTLETPTHGGVTDACPDAETLAAWTSGNLSGAALESMQLHVAGCPRCLEVAGTLSRLGAAVPHAEPAPSSRRWLTWLVPLGAAAAAVAIWFAVPGNLGKPPTGAELARDAAATPASVSQPPAPESEQRARGDEGQAKRRSEANSQVETATPPAEERQTLREAPAPAATPPAAAAARDERETAVRNDAPATPPQEAGAVAGPPVAKEAKAATADTARDKVDAARAAPAAPAAFAARAALAADIVSPDPAVRWRLVGGAVQHSANGGATWEAVSTGSPAELTAGVAPAPAVCWLVGRNGVVMLTIDGRTWRRVPFPETIDLSAVRAVDAGGRVATVVASDGRTFVTTDAGSTWAAR